jgi:hypothetical protein
MNRTGTAVTDAFAVRMQYSREYITANMTSEGMETAENVHNSSTKHLC